MVRVVTCSRSASSPLVRSERACSSVSKESNRPAELRIPSFSSRSRNFSFRNCCQPQVMNTNAGLRAHTVSYPTSDLDDLADRLARTRWPVGLPNHEWPRGVPIGYLQALVERWRSRFDWRDVEVELNRHQPTLATVDENDYLVLHAVSPEADALPTCPAAWISELRGRVPGRHRTAERPHLPRGRPPRRLPRHRPLPARFRACAAGQRARLDHGQAGGWAGGDHG